MERSIIIRHTGEIYAGLTFNYDQYCSGQMYVEKKSAHEVTVDGQTFREVFNNWSRFEQFEHNNINDFNELLPIDQQIFFDTFRTDINKQGLDDRDFGFDYLDNIIQTRFLFDQNNIVIGQVKIDSRHDKQYKAFSFSAFNDTLTDLQCNNKEPFKKINKHILSEFMNGDIKQRYPDCFLY